MTDEKYVGDVILYKTFSPDFPGKKRIPNNGEHQKYIQEDHRPAIISRETFRAVQEMRESRSNIERHADGTITRKTNGIIQGIRPLISYNYGAGQWERVKKISGTAEVFIIGIMLFGTAVCQLFPEQLISIYSEDAAIVQYGVTALTIISLGFAISSLSVVASGVCEALGKGLLSLIISLIRYIVVIIPASVIFSKMWEANGVYVAFVFTEFTAALISALLMKKVLKKR